VTIARSHLALVVLWIGCSDPTPSSAPAQPHRLAVVPPGASPVDAAIALGMTPLAVDERGMPRLLRAAFVPAAPARTATESARVHVARLAPAWAVRAATMPALDAIGEVPVRGGTIVRLRQLLDGLPVDGGELRVFVRPNGELVAVNGALVATDAPRATLRFSDDEAGAIAHAVRHVYGVGFDRSALARNPQRLLAGRSGTIDVQMAIARQAWHREGTALVPAWIVEAYASPVTSTNGDAFRTVIADGRVLAHRSLVADAAFSYRVFAETTGELHPFDGPIADVSPHPAGTPDGSYPAYVPPALVTVESLNGPNDPWLLANRTETLGNNVEAYTDVKPPSGLTLGDFRATVTSPNVFNRTFNTAKAPLASQGQQMAAVTSLFYVINWLHDFWYDAGFVEAAGNAQDNNFGRGGEDRDALLAEAQDNALGGSRNNANMSTPSDGLPPRMQVFVWSGPETRTLALQPSGRTPATGAASFGPSNFDLVAEVVLGEDVADPNANPNDGCTPLANTVTGKIVLVDRGSCSFKTKALNIQNAGGAGMLLANNAASTSPPTLGDDATITTAITIPMQSVLQTEGAAIKAELVAGPVTATMHREVEPDLDGGTDATLIAHEFGHYLHHRLQLCGTRMCGAISEGWGDFLALITMARSGDDLTGAYPFGVYVTQSFSADPAYFGIRRAPYSVNPAINSLSFRHMADGEALPTTHPFLTFGNNAEVHNGGEIWASVMWEGYVALQAAGTDFDEVRAKMAQYIVAGLLLAPVDATPTETRDAILAAAFAASPADHDVLVAAFARRGLGSCAVSPLRDSIDFSGISESIEVRGRALPGAAATADSVASCDDDGILDGGETARITVPITNQGHAPITDATVTLTSTTPGITIVSAPITIASLGPYATTDAVIDVAFDDSATTPVAGDFTLTIAAAGACGDPVSTPITLRLNVDDVGESSATDTFDAATSVWAPTFVSVWKQGRESALDGLWLGADLGVTSDGALESPALTADATTPLTVTFTHRYSFEFAANTAFDGGVIEYSIDDGATWQDVKDLVPTIGYSATPLDAGNPLATRSAFTGDSAGYPATETVTLDFGTQLAGMTFKLRFRIATDGGVGAPGWEIDDVAFTGITGTPFPAQVADTGVCGVMPPDGGVEPGTDGGIDPMPPGGGDGGCCDAGPYRAGNGALALVVLVLLRRRRRPGGQVANSARRFR
jgi:hypothetical protein